MLIGVDLLRCGLWHRRWATGNRAVSALLPVLGDDTRLVIFDDGSSGPCAHAAHPFVDVLRLDGPAEVHADRLAAAGAPVAAVFCPYGKVALDLPRVPVVAGFFGGSEFLARPGADPFSPDAADCLHAAQRASAVVTACPQVEGMLGSVLGRSDLPVTLVPPLLPPASAAARPGTAQPGQPPLPLVLHTGTGGAGLRTLLEACLAIKERGRFQGILLATGGPAAALLRSEFAGLRHFVVPLGVEEALAAAAEQAPAIVLDDLVGAEPSLLGRVSGYGRPLVLPDRRGLPERVGRGAFPYSPGHPGDLADALDAATRGCAGPTPADATLSGEGSGVPFAAPLEVARLYEDAFRAARAHVRRHADFVGPVHADGWVGRDLVVACSGRSADQTLTVRLNHVDPPPSPGLGLVAATSDGERVERAGFVAGTPYVVRAAFGPGGGVLRLRFSGLGSPAATNPDELRPLSLRLDEAEVECLGKRTSLAGGAQDAPWVAMLDQDAGTALLVLAPLAQRPTEGIAVELAPPAGLDELPGSAWIRSPHGALEIRSVARGGRVRLEVPRLGPRDVLSWQGAGATGAIRVHTAEGEAEPMTFRSRRIAAPPSYVLPDQTPGFSVVMSSSGAPRSIGGAIGSVLSQEGLADFHVVETGGEGTLAALRQHGGRLVVSSAPGMDHAGAVNGAIVRGRGEYVSWLEPDAEYYPDAFGRAADAFADAPEADVVFGDSDDVDADGIRVVSRHRTAPFSLPLLLERRLFRTPAAFVRRTALARHGLLRPGLSSCLDYELWVRLALQGARFVRSHHLYARTRRPRPGSSAAGRAEACHEAAEMMAQCFGRYSPRWADAFADQACALRGLPRSGERMRGIARAYWSSRARTFRQQLRQGSQPG